MEYRHVHSFDLMTRAPLRVYLQFAPLYTVVLDNNALLRDTARATRRQETTFLGRALRTGILRAVITADVLDEYADHLHRIAEIHKVNPEDMHQVFMEQYAPFVLMVNPPKFDTERSKILKVQDEEDLPTGHLIEWLSPDVVLHNDKHLMRAGYGPKIQDFANVIKALSWDTQKEYVQLGSVMGLHVALAPVLEAGEAGWKWAKKNPTAALVGTALAGVMGWWWFQDPERKARFQEGLVQVKKGILVFLEGLTAEMTNITYNIEAGKPLLNENATPHIPCVCLEDALVRVLLRSRKPLLIEQIREHLPEHWTGEVPSNLQMVLQNLQHCLKTKEGWVLNWPSVNRALEFRLSPSD